MSHSAEVSSSVERRPELSVRLVVADHYMGRPIPGIDVIHSEFRGADIKQVPVLRIFGPASDGHKACLHVHGVFPYFYIPCGVSSPAPQLLYQVAASLDKALNISLKQANSVNQHVYKITLVKGMPFYGFHYKEHLFFKIFLYNPGLIKQAVELFNNGAILGQVFQPHEAHLNFTLQFFIDFNLFGMSNVDLQVVKFRKKPSESSYTSSGEMFSSPDESSVKVESCCYYEADVLASHIINRQRIGKGDGIENPGLEEVWTKELERRKQLNMTLGSTSLTQDRANEETESHYRFEKMFWLKISNLIEQPVEVSPAVEPAYYPAESMEGSQLLNASDVSLHLPCKTLESTLSESIKEEDITIVDEHVAFNCSLAAHFSQGTLDSEDLDFIELLKDMEQPVDDDSILGTQVESRLEVEDLDDAEYSQIFNDTTLVQDNAEIVNGTTLSEENTEVNDNEDDVNWNDSFWDGANIPQLDGTCDDEHTKKVRKRKLPRTRSLGLSHPKAKNKITITKSLEENNKTCLDDIDEIGPSQTSLQKITKTIKKGRHIDVPIIETSNDIVKVNINNENGDKDKNELSEEINQYVENNIPALLTESQKKIENIGKKINVPTNKVIETDCDLKLETSVLYDLKNNFEPLAGPSNINVSSKNNYEEVNEVIDNSFNSNSTPDKGILSFYNMSKIFDTSVDINNHNIIDIEENEIKVEANKDKLITEIKTEKASPSKSILDGSTFLQLRQTSSTMKTLSSGLDISRDALRRVILTPKFRPPTRKDIVSSLSKYNIPAIRTQEPYYSNYKDVGSKLEVGQIMLKISSKAAQHQKPFPSLDGYKSIEEWRKYLFLEHNGLSQEITDISTLKSLLAGNKKCVLEPIQRPPNAKEVRKWLESREDLNVLQKEKKALEQVELSKALDELDNSQAIGLDAEEINHTLSLESEDTTEPVLVKPDINESLQVSMQPDGSYLCFGGVVNQSDTWASETPSVECDFLTIMAIEIHSAIRQDLNPDPQFDAMQAIFITITNDSPPNHFLPKSITEVVVADENPQKLLERCGLSVPVTYVKDEKALIEHVVATVKKWDPDILCAFEIELNSWGYLLERAEVLGADIVPDISRITEKHRQKKWRSDDKSYEGRILGRVIFNVWRMLRHELALSSYSFESTMYHILKERVPDYSHSALAKWWTHETNLLRWMTVEYYLTRLSGTIRMLEKLDMINRTSELARLFGLQWWEVLSRGSQFRVESLMLRAARPLNLIALSPSVKQRALMKAPECLPLIFEPESRFYSDPVIVLDFQSLYPSMMIAYNYCFSTCIGKAQNISGDHSYEFGAWRLRIPRDKLEALVKNKYVHWSPVGAGFVSSEIRRGVLPALLRRILAARQAVKKSMKMQTDEAVKKAMHSRQLGLKLIANVTYGYTAANFSGRMPCVEIGDSVVAKGRETLERAIKLVEEDKRWNVKVVYGDTDSMFVLVPGGDRQQAFRIGQEIADAVTADNPSPVALKLEKVYQPCILQTKKRYVGYMYESPEQQAAVYEAKGIETVRRDGCPVAVKLLQRSLCELFSSGDVSEVKRLVTSALSRLVDGQMPIQELFFTREYHGAAGYRPGAAAPPLEIARRLARADRRSVPRAGERVAWAVCAGAPGLPLVRLARTPRELRADGSLRPHAQYYVTRAVLPPLHRCLSLIGADVFKWYSEIPHRTEAGAGGIAQYMQRGSCPACGRRAAGAVCRACAARPQRAAAALASLVRRDTACREACDTVCRSCCGHSLHSACVNTECPALWRQRVAQRKLRQTTEALRALPPPLRCTLLDDF